MAEFLLELYSEEIPAKMQLAARDQIVRICKKKFDQYNLKAPAIVGFVTPMRLGLIIENLKFDSAKDKDEIRGPRFGAPDIAVQGFLKKNNILESELNLKKTEKGDFYVYQRKAVKRELSEIMATISKEIIFEFSWPKSMVWGSDYSLRWIRPLKSILALLFLNGKAILVPIDARGIKSDVYTKGHAVMFPEPFEVKSIDEYYRKLAGSRVILQPEDREKRILKMTDELAKKAGFTFVEDKSLLQEITGLSEFPTPMLGEIPKTYLKLPEEVIITTMREHQKFISLVKAETGRVEGFVLASNILTSDKQNEVLEGNTRVLNSRLSDALFFYKNDKKKINESGMESFYEKLKEVRFHQELGSQYERVGRILKLAEGLSAVFDIDKRLVSKAVKLMKADLISEMVIEFPSLQGIIGSYYALLDGNSLDVANAIKKHYSPVGPTDNIPKEDLAIILAISEKLDYLISFWSIKIKPTGSKDPFALRRACLGVIRIIIENNLRINVNQLLDLSDLKFDKIDILNFFRERVINYLTDQGHNRSITLSVVNTDNFKLLYLFPILIKIIEEYITTPQGLGILAINKRTVNILTGFNGNIESIKKTLEEVGVREDLELKNALIKAENGISSGLKKVDFNQIKANMTALIEPVNKFFDGVQVNCKDQDLRLNRFRLLIKLQKVFKMIAVFSYIEAK